MSKPDIDVNDLHQDLQPFFKAEGILTIDHPLLRMSSASATKINDEYQRRLDSIRKSLRDKEWVALLDTFEAPYQLLAFSVVSEQMSDIEYWEALRFAWMSTENPFQYLNLCVKLFRSSRPCRDELMSQEDKATLERLPPKLTICRGHSPEFQNRKGISWTLKWEIAQRLGGRRGRYMAGKDAEIREEIVKKDEIIAFMNLRNEEEIIYLGDFHDEVGKNDPRTEELIVVIRNCLGI
jgi:hypothetical protein